MVADQRGFVVRKVCYAEVAEYVQEVGEPSQGALVDEQNLVTDEFEKAVGCRRALGRVITSVEQKKKFKSEERLGSLVKECVAKVEDELLKRNRDFQMVTEAGEIGKGLYQQTVVEDGDEMDKNHEMENNESVGGFVLEDQFEEVDGQWNGDGGAGLQQRGELGEVDDVIEHEELLEGNLEPIGDGSVGMDEVDQSVELRCAREGEQLVSRRNVESRNGIPGDEAKEMDIVGIQETGNQNIRVRTGPEARGNIKGSPQSLQARQIWLKMDRLRR